MERRRTRAVTSDCASCGVMLPLCWLSSSAQTAVPLASARVNARLNLLPTSEQTSDRAQKSGGSGYGCT